MERVMASKKAAEKDKGKPAPKVIRK